MAVSIIQIEKEVVIDICGKSTDVFNNLFFYSDNRNSQNLTKRAILRSNFTAVVGSCGAKNKKMVLTNVVQDAILYLNMNCQHMLQKFPYPNIQGLYLESNFVTLACCFELGWVTTETLHVIISLLKTFVIVETESSKPSHGRKMSFLTNHFYILQMFPTSFDTFLENDVI